MKTYTLRGEAPGSSFRRRFAGELNPQQLEVATCPDGPALVLAGAGSGKTRAVTYRVAYLIDRGLDPEDIVLLTFTNKAAREMLRRVEALVRVAPGRLWGGTFHRVANLVLRRHADRLGYGANYTILDREDARELLDAAIADLDVDPAERRFPKGDVLAAAMSLAANTQRDLTAIVAERWPMFADLDAEIGTLARRYGERKRERNAMDYDDLLLNFRCLLDEHEPVRRLYAGRFRHVLVDEYQDTNRIQAAIVDHLAGVHRNLMVVGDDAQSIYSFRGAAFENILDFPGRYPDARVLKLELNYRSSPEIVRLANHAIAGNPRQHPKNLTAQRPAGIVPALVGLRDAAQQSAFVASRILELRDEGVPIGDIGVLYRSHWHSLELQMELTRRRVPYEVRSGVRFFESAHVKDVIAHLRIVANPVDEVSWRRVLRLLPRIGNRTAERIFRALAARPRPLEALLDGAADAVVPRAAARSMGGLKALLVDLSAPEVRERPAELIRRVLHGDYATRLHESYEDAESRLEELNQLALYALNFDGVESFLTDLALSNSLEAEGAGPGSGEDEPRLVLSTVHQAKGLEWRAVFVLWLVDGRFPSARSLREDPGAEEERRLFYVAVTRARDELYLCYPQVGRDEWRQDVLFKPSRFLEELPLDVTERWRIEDPAAEPRDEDGGPRERDLFDDGPSPDDY